MRLSPTILKLIWGRLFLSFLTASFASTSMVAQAGEVSSGGEAKGGNGTASYSVGQVVFSALNNNEVTPGLQQSYLVLQLLDHDELVSVYPNPSFGKVTLRVNSKNLTDYNFQLADVWGHSLISDQVTNIETSLGLEPFANAMYFIKVFRKGREVKVFKIIKSQ